MNFFHKRKEITGFDSTVKKVQINSENKIKEEHILRNQRGFALSDVLVIGSVVGLMVYTVANIFMNPKARARYDVIAGNIAGNNDHTCNMGKLPADMDTSKQAITIRDEEGSIWLYYKDKKGNQASKRYIITPGTNYDYSTSDKFVWDKQ